MRALETGRYMLRGTNNGVTAIIDNKGRITETIPHFQRATLSGEVFTATGSTPYMADRLMAGADADADTGGFCPGAGYSSGCGQRLVTRS